MSLNNACRDKNVGFLYAGNLGLYGFTFVDFGPKHKINDKDGEEPKSAVVMGITREKEGVVCCHEEKRHGFESGDFVVIKEVKGMEEVNGKLWKIEVKSPLSFTIGDTSGFAPYLSNGIVSQVKVPVEVEFKSLENSLVNPYAPGRKEMDLCSWEKIGRPEELHVILNALLKFYSIHRRIPRNLNEEDG